MKPTSISNAMVSVVGLYAEIFAEQAQAIDQLSGLVRSQRSVSGVFAAIDNVLHEYANACEVSDTAISALQAELDAYRGKV